MEVREEINRLMKLYVVPNNETTSAVTVTKENVLASFDRWPYNYLAECYSLKTIKQIIDQDIKMEDFQGNDLARLLILRNMEEVYLITGLKNENWPGDNEALNICQHIINRFSFLSPEEIKRAFLLLLENKFSASPSREDNHGIEHFQHVSIKYFHRVLDSYSRWKNERQRKFEEKIRQERDKKKDRRQAAIKNNLFVKSKVIELFVKIKAGQRHKISLIDVRDHFYDWFVQLGFIRDGHALDKEVVMQKKMLPPSASTNWATIRAKKKCFLDTLERIEEKEFEIFKTISYVQIQ